jgi:hypothetical protein
LGFGFCWVIRARVPFWVSNAALCRLIFESLPLGGPHKPQSFSTLLHRLSKTCKQNLSLGLMKRKQRYMSAGMCYCAKQKSSSNMY